MDESLKDMATQWSLLRMAHDGSFSSTDEAKRELSLRYSAAVRRYTAVIVRDPHAADEIAQDVMVRLMKGDFAGADPERGRFRDLLRHSIRNMMRNYYAKENRRQGAELDEQFLPGEEDETIDPWLNQWVRCLLETTWKALEQYENKTKGSVAYSVLRLRSEHPDEDSETLAKLLSQKSGRIINAAATRQQLRRARLRFAELLVEEVARGLKDPNPAAVETELISLDLMSYVKPFLPEDWLANGELRELSED